MKATYVSVWDGGIEVESNCTFDTKTKIVDDIEIVGVQDLTFFDSHYVRLPDGEQLECDYDEDNNIVAEGRLVL